MSLFATSCGVKKSSQTTPVRPVFSASCRVRRNHSLNDTLWTGPNLILLITDVLLGFRKKPVAFTTHMKKAFRMIEVDKADRYLLRFLW